jgi:septum formation protein
MKPIILASGSPRRIKLLKNAGVKFKAVESSFKEVINKKLKPHQVVKKLSLGKAHAVAEKFPKAIIIGADTVVWFKGRVLGKPHTPKKAVKMLEFLNGAVHYIYTGFSVIDTETGRIISKVQKTKVCFRKMTVREIADYVRTGEPLDRAGAYAIQGGAKKFVKKIEGGYDNALGLPVKTLKEALKVLNRP